MKMIAKIAPVAWIMSIAVIVTYCSDDGAVELAEVAKVQSVEQTKHSAPNDGWRMAGGNLYSGSQLYFGRHDKIYRGHIVSFIDSGDGELVVLQKDGKFELVPRRTIVLGDFWVKADAM